MSNRVIRSFLKSLGLNLLAGGVGILPFFFAGSGSNSDSLITWGLILIIIAVISLITQLVIGIRFTNNPEKKEEGQGMLLAVGVLTLVGVAVCGPMWI
jgi:uncharacterized membrane protein YdbT with pleckstrin-like domain